MREIETAQLVELTVDKFGKTWINIDGVCAIRIGKADHVQVEGPHTDDIVIIHGEIEKLEY